MNALLEKIFRGEAINPEVSGQILEIMKQCRTGNSRIKGLLPEGTPVAHKTGSIGQTTNDVGIIYLPDGEGHLAVTLFSKEMKGSREEVEKLIAEICRLAFDYFTLVP